MPNVAEIIKDHVTLEVRCIDRLYPNAYVPRLQSSGGVVDFLVRACRHPAFDSALAHRRCPPHGSPSSGHHRP